MINEIKSVGIIGAGTMGQGIAQVCASAGFSVLIYDIQAAMVDAALTRIASSLQGLVDKSKITAQEKTETISRITAVKEMSSLRCDLIIEAAAENLEIKRKI